MAETWAYNRVNGGDSWWGKNIIGVLFYATGHIGATRVAARSIDTSARIGSSGCMWCVLLALNTLKTLQLQDLRDTEGDKARCRNTMPIAMGDTLTEWITAAFIAMRYFVYPGYWVADGYLTAAFVLPVAVGLVVVLRMLMLRTSKADRMTF